MALLLGIDFGTSYFKVGLFDLDGTLRGLGRVRVEKQTPAPGRCELPVVTFWALLRQGLAEALAQADASAEEIVGLSYSSQASTFILLDREDRPLTPFIVWTDTRGGPPEAALAEFAQSERFARTVGFAGLAPESAPVKWRWLAREMPELWARTARVMTLSDYFTFTLTGERAGDASTAAFLGAYDLDARAWWSEALTRYGVADSQLSTPRLPGCAVGATTARARALLGVPSGVAFAVGALDHHAAAIGSGLGTLANVSISTGTVLAALVLVDEVRPMAGCFHGPHTDGRRFYRLAFDSRGAGQLEDYQRAHAPDRSIEALLALAGGTSSETGPSDAHGRAVRHILESVSATHRRLVESVLPGGRIEAVVATGGGSRSPLWLQLTATALGVRVVTPSSPERACLGAATFAAAAAGLHPSLETAAQAMIRGGPHFDPVTY